MNEPKVNVRTGFFVFLGISLFIASIIFFGGDRAFLKNYALYQAKFSSTQGLAAGSVVSISGIEVGNVKAIQFGKGSEIIADLNIDKKYINLLSSESLVSIRTQGALGDRYVFITPGTQSGSPLPEHSFIPTDTQPDFMDIISGKASDFSSAADVVREMNLLLHNLNADGKSAALMTNLVEFSQNLSKMTAGPSARESLSHFNNILKKIDSGTGTLGLLINDSTLHERILSIIGEPARNKFLKPMLRKAIEQSEQKK